jgi:hypothetical protein
MLHDDGTIEEGTPTLGNSPEPWRPKGVIRKPTDLYLCPRSRQSFLLRFAVALTYYPAAVDPLIHTYTYAM